MNELTNKLNVIIQFNSEKTPGDIYSKTISSIEDATGFIIALGDAKMVNDLRMKLSDLSAQVYNAQARMKR